MDLSYSKLLTNNRAVRSGSITIPDSDRNFSFLTSAMLNLKHRLVLNVGVNQAQLYLPQEVRVQTLAIRWTSFKTYWEQRAQANTPPKSAKL